MSRPSDVQGLEDFDLVTLGGMLGVCEVDLLTLSPVRPRAAVASKTHDGVTYLSAHIDFDVRGSLTVPEDACMLVYLHEAGERSWCQGIGVEADMAVTLLRGTPTDFMFERGTQLTLVVAPYARFRSRFLASDHADVDMDLRRIQVMPNTANAHRLLALAMEQGSERQVDNLLERLFTSPALRSALASTMVTGRAPQLPPASISPPPSSRAISSSGRCVAESPIRCSGFLSVRSAARRSSVRNRCARSSRMRARRTFRALPCSPRTPPMASRWWRPSTSTSRSAAARSPRCRSTIPKAKT